MVRAKIRHAATVAAGTPEIPKAFRNHSEISDAAHASNGFVDPARFRFLHGEDLLESFEVPDAERFTQHFCRDCGSPMPRTFPNRPYVVVPMGGVDGEPGSRPREHIFVGSKAPWYEIADSLPQHAEYAPA